MKMMQRLNSDSRCSDSGKRQRGFSLVEVLIALVVMSVGMLGIAGLYVQSMQAGRTSMFRHQAVTLAGDVADRIRANPRAAGAYSTAYAASADNGCVAGTKNCTPAEMASQDIRTWGDQALETLPAGSVAIVFGPAVGTAPPTYQITVNWNEPGAVPTPSFSITIPVLGI